MDFLDNYAVIEGHKIMTGDLRGALYDGCGTFRLFVKDKEPIDIAVTARGAYERVLDAICKLSNRQGRKVIKSHNAHFHYDKLDNIS